LIAVGLIQNVEFFVHSADVVGVLVSSKDLGADGLDIVWVFDLELVVFNHDDSWRGNAGNSETVALAEGESETLGERGLEVDVHGGEKTMEVMALEVSVL
jgi:hypothetical protein